MQRFHASIKLLYFFFLRIMCALITIYAGILTVWMFGKEIPQYTNGAYVDYDSIWFEGCATRWGEKCFPLG